MTTVALIGNPNTGKTTLLTRSLINTPTLVIGQESQLKRNKGRLREQILLSSIYLVYIHSIL